MLQHAFKEWAVICRALADGRQALVLRKGGIAEAGGTFQVEHTRFWLYPTYVHQQRAGIKPEAVPLLEQAEAERPPAGMIRLSHFTEVAGVYQAQNLVAALALDELHLWSAATVLMGLTNSLGGMLLGRILLGIGVSALPVATRAMSNWTVPEKRGFAQGITHAFARLGNAITPPIVAWLIALVTWRGLRGSPASFAASPPIADQSSASPP